MTKKHVAKFQFLACFAVACGQGSSEPSAAGHSERCLMSASTRDVLSPARVLQTTHKVTSKLVSIETAEGTLLTTPDHLFARFSGGWVPAGQLSVGEKIVSAAAPQGSPIIEIASKDVAETSVYNLTIAKTHSYLVSSAGLLVHNVDCWGRERPRDDDSSTDGESSARSRTSLEELIARTREEELREKRRFNDSEGRLAFENCVYCTLGGLSDFDKLSVFLRDSGLNERQRVSPKRNHELLERFKLRSENTPPPATFQRSKKRRWPHREDPQRDAQKFMQESSSNTFALIIKPTPQSPVGHSMIAVRQPDGSITYVDLQQTPPKTYDGLNPKIQLVEVIPTDVDWRFNRQLSKVVRESPPSDRREGWAM
jgi:hypothetical protein